MENQNGTPASGILSVISGDKPIRTSIEFDLVTSAFLGLVIFMALTAALVIAKKV